MDPNVNAKENQEKAPPVTIRSLKAIPFFEDKPVTALMELSEHAQMRFFAPGETVFKEKDTSGELFVVARGEIALTATDEQGRVFNLAKLKKGDFFGEQGCMLDIPRSTNAIASKDSGLIVFPRVDAKLMIQSHAFLKMHVETLLKKRTLNRKRVIMLKLIEKEFKNNLEAISQFIQNSIKRAETKKQEILEPLETVKRSCSETIQLLEKLLGSWALDDLNAIKIETVLTKEVEEGFLTKTDTMKSSLASCKSGLIEIGTSTQQIELLSAAIDDLNQKRNLIIDFYWLQTGRDVVSTRITNLEADIKGLSEFESTLEFKEARLMGNVLIIESNLLQQNILNQQLNQFGLNVHVSVSGEEGVSIAKERDIDVICVELLSPDKNAFQVIDVLKHDDRCKHIPVLVLSSLEDLDTGITCLEMGAKEFLHKPVPNPILFASIKRALAEMEAVRREQKFLDELQVEKDKSEDLLLNILPKPIAERLKVNPGTIADTIEMASVFFCDLCNFSKMTNGMPAEMLVEKLNALFSSFDDIVKSHGVEKIKTMGDAYMAIAGAPIPQEDHALRMMKVAVDFMKVIEQYNKENKAALNMRLGIHSGKLTAGVVGKQKFVYDIWGDTVNLASRMESTGPRGCVQVSEFTYKMLKDQYTFKGPESIKAKGFGEVKTYLHVYEPLAKLESDSKM